MKPIFNEATNIQEITSTRLPKEVLDATRDAEYLTALLVAAFVRDFKFNPDDERFANVTPNQWHALVVKYTGKIESFFEDTWMNAECEFEQINTGGQR